MQANVDKILDFYEKSILFEKISLMSYDKKNSTKKLNFDFININQIEIINNKINIRVNKQLEMFLLNDSWKNRGISPINLIENKTLTKEERTEINENIEKQLELENLDIENEEWTDREFELNIEYGLRQDSNQLLVSPLYIKIIFEEEDSTLFIPLIFIDITEHKIKMRNHPYSDSDYLINIDLNESNVIYNDFATSLFLNENMKEIFDSLLYVSNTDYLSSAKDFFLNFYKDFEDKLSDIGHDFKIELPDINKDSEPIFLFFNQENEVEIIENFNEIKNSKNKLLEEFLLKTKEESKTVVDFEKFYLGSKTDKYKLSQGQAIVLEQNQSDKKLIPVLGGPGTGKTTLLLSVITNNVVKRAISNILHNEDYNNLMLITSTSNKAIENIVEDIKSEIDPNFFFLGGNLNNRRESFKKIESIIDQFNLMDFREDQEESIKNRIIEIHNIISNAEEYFNKTKKLIKEDLKIPNIESLSVFNINDDERLEYNLSTKSIEEFNTIYISKLNMLNELNEDIAFYFDFLRSKDYFLMKKTIEKIENTNPLFDLFGATKKHLNTFNKENKTLEFSSIEVFEEVFSILKLCENQMTKIESDLKVLIKFERLEKMKDLDINEIKNVLEFKDFGEFFRIKYSDLNYEIFDLSKTYLQILAFKRKYSVLDSLKYLASGNFYNIKNPEQFLKDISLLIPVFTSTLAGFKYMFNSLNTSDLDYIYELLICDEAGMVKVSDLLKPLTKSNRAIIVGDPKQLPPIISLNYLFDLYLREKTKEFGKDFYKKYSSTEISAFHRAAGTSEGGYLVKGDSIILDEHRRCQKPIAELFMKVAEYEGIKIKTEPKPLFGIEPFKYNLAFIHTENKKKKDPLVNENEINLIIDILESLSENDNFDITKDIGIITPFVKQEQAIISAVGDLIGHSYDNKKIGTIHKFQGSEFKVIIFSSVVSGENDSLFFINKDPSLVNVAISRAKELFILIGDKNKINGKEPGNYIGRMAEEMIKHEIHIEDLF